MPLDVFSAEYAWSEDDRDPLRHLRSEFIVPSKHDLQAKRLREVDTGASEEICTYLCGNSLGLQPKRTSKVVSEHLNAWAKKGVYGHFMKHEDSNLSGFLNLDAEAADMMAPLVGAKTHEVAIMETLTANLHLMLASFYRPNKDKYKIILEGKAFPSDHYAIESQIIHNGFDPRDAMICIEPRGSSTAILETSQILSAIDDHASTTALILLPGVQYYTGQYLDIKVITMHAHSHGIAIGWDLAHAVGNVELSLHEWDVDFAVWCNYKYVNAGPGAVAGLFVNEKHGFNDQSGTFRPRLSGWWGGDKAIRFEMGRQFVPIPGAQGFQIGNPSSLAISALIASLEVFQMTSVDALRQKSIKLTAYLEQMLLESPFAKALGDQDGLPYEILTPSASEARGAQLSVRLLPNMLEDIMADLEYNGVVVDERKPDVVRVAPAPMYNSFKDVWNFAQIFINACANAKIKLKGPKTRGGTS
ncbi:uncharacterized protein KY384_005487 [Bacidia gigantensis]|uniref:uncharacterized protein n=1 Tax=Bacidia gigantensis TaxID=2732470 RepID=UPI001D05046A|nr:uncharacterized protein KY384_005487 [Bacidia gigantensis]KAG8530005.1 hypothetical protein KY384_005487 [Bacidia gigantensis]